MNAKLLTLLLTLTTLIAQAQRSAFYDALYLKSVIDSSSSHKFSRSPSNTDLFNYYFGKNLPQLKFDSLVLANPFLKSYYSTNQAQSVDRSGLSSIWSSVGGINVTNFADGLAKFMVERFKQELDLAFFQKFQDEINKYPELQKFFPETYNVLKTLGVEIYRYNTYILTLREAFLKDLTNLYANLPVVLELPQFQSFLNANPDLKTILYTSLYLVSQISHDVNPGDIIAKFDLTKVAFTDTNLTANVTGSIKTLQLISQSVRSKSADHYWISPDSLTILLNEKISFQLYLGLIYQKSVTDNIVFAQNRRLSDLLANLAGAFNTSQALIDSLERYKIFIETFVSKATDVSESIKNIRSKPKSEVDYNDYYKVFSGSLNLVQYSFTIVDLPYVKTIIPDHVDVNKIKVISNKWFFVARSAGELYIDVRTKNYSSAILSAIAIMDSVADPSSNVRVKILKYGSFMAAVAAAQNSDELKNAIEAVALPVGGSAIKKTSSFNIAVQSYMGGSIGKEDIRSLPTDNAKPVLSVVAPVGISFSKGLATNSKCPWSVSVMATLIDIGALASFRLNDDTTSISSNIKLENIIAPGGYLVFGLPRVPISVGGGVQVGPQLRSIKEGVPQIDTQDVYVRYSVFVAVDIPLFNLYNKVK